MSKELLLISVASDSHRNIGCLSLYATAADAGIATNLLFIPRRNEFNKLEFFEYLKTNQFAIVGISLTTRDFYFACDITAQIRKSLPDAHVVWGGIHATSRPEECLDHADSICIGEGEQFILQLLSALKKQEDISIIPGIGFKNRRGEIIINPPRLINDLNSLPFPHFDFEKFYVLDEEGLHLFGPKDYVKYSKHNGDGYVLLTTRSCPHHCTYCINSFLNRLYGDNLSRLQRRRTVDNTLEEISRALSTIHGIGFINFLDDHFLTNDEWIREFCDKYRQQVNLPFIIRATPVTIEEDIIAALKTAGLSTVQMGIQSGSKRTHDTIFRRSFNSEIVLRAAKILNSYNLECLYDFIIENDFETNEDRDKTIELMLRLPKPYTASLFVMTVFPKTALEVMYKEKHMKPRIDPYSSNYYEFNENDFYYQLASLIPSIDEKRARFIFDNRNDHKVLSQLKTLYMEKFHQQ